MIKTHLVCLSILKTKLIHATKCMQNISMKIVSVDYTTLENVKAEVPKLV